MKFGDSGGSRPLPGRGWRRWLPETFSTPMRRGLLRASMVQTRTENASLPA